MVICPRSLAALIAVVTLWGCAGGTTPSGDGGDGQNAPGDTSVPTSGGGDSGLPAGDAAPSDSDATPSGGDSTAGGDDDSANATPAHTCRDVYDKIVSCCSVMAYRTQTRFMLECELDPFTPQQRDQFVATSCDQLAPLCSVGNVCPAGLSCFQIGIGVGVCADNGNYPANAKACSISLDCDAGLACYGDGTTNYCVQTCIPAGDGYTVGQCPTNRTCLRLSDGTDVCADGSSVPADATTCNTTSDCDSGWSCVAPSSTGTGYCLQQCIGS